MTTRTKTTAAALTGAVVLASGAYALGTQSGGGDATAAAKGKRAARVWRGPDGRPGLRRGLEVRGPFGLQSLADKLGVSQDKLRTALDALATDKRDELATKLADALGIDASKVKQALADLKPPGGPPGPPPGLPKDGFAGVLADKLGLDVAKVRSALQSLSPDDFRQAGGPAAAIAKALGVDEAKVSDALKSLRPPGPPGAPGSVERHRGPFGPDLTALADKLGVTTDNLKAAFQKLEAGERDDFATALAGKLGIDPQKVKDALPAKGDHWGHGP